MNSLGANYGRVLEVLRKISSETLLCYHRRAPRMKDLEVVSLTLTAEYMGIDSENRLFRQIPSFLSNKIERSVYNRRKRKLSFKLCDQFMIRRNYAKTFEGFKARILAKITALTIVQFINKNYLNRNINNLKSNLF